MSTVSLTAQTSLIGQALKDAITAETTRVFNTGIFAVGQARGSWSGNTFSMSGLQMNGTIVVSESGRQSTVSVTVNLTGVISQSHYADVESALRDSLSRLGGTAAPYSAPSTSTASTTGQPATQEPARPRLQVDWGMTTGIIDTLGTSISNMFNGLARGTAQEVAQQYGADQSTTVQALTPSTKGQIQGQSVDPKLVAGYQQGGQPTPAPNGGGDPAPGGVPPFVMPTWGWAMIGIGGAAMVGFVIYLASRK